MISPFTPSGVKISCIDSSHRNYNTFNPGKRDLDGLTEGQVYTVAEIVLNSGAKCGYCVVLQEIVRQDVLVDTDRGFSLERFRYVDLPKCLVELLTSTPKKDSDLFEPKKSTEEKVKENA